MLKPENTPLAPDGEPFELVTIKNTAGTTATFMDWGATWLSLDFPLADGTQRELLLGCESPHQYVNQSAYLGATVGRYANRIAKAQLTIDGQICALEPNQGENQLHGGPAGFSARRWKLLSHSEQTVSFQLISANGDQGYPGNMTTEVHYRLTEDNRLEIRYQATVDKLCPINLTNHAYFNLDGEGHDARKQKLQLFADRFLPVDSDGIPSAGLTAVENSGLDFSAPKTLAEDFLRDREQQRVKGYDHAWLLNRTCHSGEHPAAHLWSADGKIKMSVFTSAPALQVYSGNFLRGTPNRSGGEYENYQGVALETEFLPDSPNHPEWPQANCWIKPGQSYRSQTVYQFFAL